jgi:AcrR family transcriptional regulator
MTDQENPRDRIVSAAMRLAGDRRWRDITLIDIAEAAGLTLADLKQHVASKTDVLKAFTAAIDDEVLRKAVRPQTAQSPRDSLFEVLMARFDALEPHKAALRSIVPDAVPDPDHVCAVLASQRWMLHAAGIDSEGARGVVRTLGLASVYASVFRTWLDDDDPGLARTMAALDRRLRRGEQNMKALDGMCELAARVTGLLRPRGRHASGETARRRTDDAGHPENPSPAPEQA